MKRIRELDSLRGLAAIAILGFHLHYRAFSIGWVSLDLFFVLSGYLVTAIILKHLGQEGFLRNFYARRGLRIWPIYYLSLLGLVALNAVQPYHLPTTGFWQYLTYTQNVERYAFLPRLPFLGRYFEHTWTLAIEEQFYLLWPALILLIGPKRLPVLIASSIALSVAARTAGFDWWLLLARSDGFALGALLALLLADPARVDRHRRSLRVVFLASIALPLASLLAIQVEVSDLSGPFWGAEGAASGPSVLLVGLIFFGLTGLVATHAGHPLLRPLRNPVLGYLGMISYGVYLYHMMIFRILSTQTFHRLERYCRLDLMVIALTLAASIASWHLIEKPILSLKDRFLYRHDPAAHGDPDDARPLPGEFLAAGA